MTPPNEQPEQRQERQHRSNVFKLDMNMVLTTVFGMAIMAGIGAVYAKSEELTEIKTKIPYIEAKIDILQAEQKQDADAIALIPNMMEHNRELIERDIARHTDQAPHE